ncbi:barstar family protein [Micromonospora sp. MED01]|uniref:barstar family protein n=1 Tax=Micromonospora alfalfae TaxID=2911212 RepID=UPI001EE90524|nr:barstar family protein [Micromonospora alfalfae]MCG5461584.1 barstar family protein [Micromonospora alfalfae]
MTKQSDALPVLVIDGVTFADFAGFIREFSQLLCHGTWNGNLDAFNDILREGFGTPETGWVLKWVNSDSSRIALGHDATVRWLEQTLLTCHPSHRAGIKARLNDAQRRQGQTLFDILVEIIHEHGPGGSESEDGIILELL